MYITINKEQIDIRLNPYIYVNVLGPDPLYYVELREYINNEEESRLIEGHHFNKNGAYVQSLNFSFFGEFYGDYEISVYKFVKNVGLQKIHTHRYNDCGKLVEFYLETNSIDDANTWVESILNLNEEQKKNYITEVIKSDFQEAGDEDVFKKIKKDLEGKNIQDNEIRQKMSEFLEVAKKEI